MSVSQYQKSTEHLTLGQSKISRTEALRRVRGPAFSLMLLSGAAFLVTLLGGVFVAGDQAMRLMSGGDEVSTSSGTSEEETKEEREARKKKEKQLATEKNFIFVSMVGLGGLALMLINAVVFTGAFKMRRLRGLRFSKTAAAFAVIPLLSPFLVVGIPFGIWALLTLNNAEVRRYFSG